MSDHIYTQNETAMCYDCGHDTQMMHEYYMLHNDVWWLATRGTPYLSEFMLCIGCVEKRLGRKLHKLDFSMAPINHKNEIKRSLLLKSRLGRIPSQEEILNI